MSDFNQYFNNTRRSFAFILLVTVLFASFLFATSAGAEGEGDLVIDLGTGTEVDTGSVITSQGEDGVTANNGTELPLENGNINNTDVDTGTVDFSTGIDAGAEGTQEVDKGGETTVGVTQPLAQTGISDTMLTVLVGFLVLAGLLMVYLFVDRKQKQVDQAM